MDQKTLKDIKEMIQNNDHGGAYLLSAQALGQTGLADRFDRINRRHVALGHLSPSLDFDRTVAYRELMSFAKLHLSESDYRQLC